MKHANVVKSIFAVTALLSAAGVLADTWKDPDTGYTWTYAVIGDTATICNGDSSVAISPSPTDVGRVRGLLWASGLDAYRLGFIEIGAARVAFDANGGSVGESGRDVVYGGAIGELPVPTRSGYVFGGWWTAKDSGGKQV